MFTHILTFLITSTAIMALVAAGGWRLSNARDRDARRLAK